MLIRFPNHAPQLPWGIPDVQGGDYYTYRDPRSDALKYVFPRAMNEGAVLAMVTPAQAGIQVAGTGAEPARWVSMPNGPLPQGVGNLGGSLGTIESTVQAAAAETVQAAEAAQQRIMESVQTPLPESVSLPGRPSVTLRQVGVMGLIALGAMFLGGAMARRGV